MSTKHDADVIVAGAGPAGAIAARRLARGGRRVLIVERYALPRQKPCGGGISTRVLSRFPFLGDALNRIPTLPVSELYLEGPSGDVFRMRSDGPAVLLIRRIEFDHLLVSLAVEAGARVLAPAAIAQAIQGDEHVTLDVEGRPSTHRPDGRRGRRREQRDCPTPWPQSRVAQGSSGPRHDGGDADDIVDGRGAGDAGGVLRVPRRARLRLHLPEARSRERRASDTCSRTFKSR